MNRLMPPPQRDLPEDVRREIRGTLIRTSRPTTSIRRGGHVALPAFALTGVVGAAAVVGLSLHDGESRTVGVPAPAGPVSSSTATPDGTARSAAIPAAQTIDSGPLASAVEQRIVDQCLHGSPGGGTVARVHLARQTSTAGPVVLLTDSVGVQHLCRDGIDIVGPPLDADGPLGDTQRPSPTKAQPVIQLTGFAGSGSGSKADGIARNTATSYYRVAPQVASLQVRLSVDGHAGPWFDTIIAGGYAFAYASDDHRSSDDDRAPDLTTPTHVDDRAFDADGNELDIDHAR